MHLTRTPLLDDFSFYLDLTPFILIVEAIELLFFQKWSKISDMTNIIIFIVLFIVGGLVGFVIYHFTLGKKQSGSQRQELEQIKAELAQYKSKVNTHFKDSAALMGQVASSYQALHSHMANQSQSLLSDDNNSVFPLLNDTSPESKDSSLSNNGGEDKHPVDEALDAGSSELKDSGESPQVNNGTEAEISNENADDKDDKPKSNAEDKPDTNDGDKADSNAEDKADSNAEDKADSSAEDKAVSNPDEQTNEKAVDYNDKKTDAS